MSDTPRRRRGDGGFAMLDHLMRKAVPAVLTEHGMGASGALLAQQPPLNTEEASYLAVQSLAALYLSQALLVRDLLDSYGVVAHHHDRHPTRGQILERQPDIEDLLRELDEAV